MLNDLLTQLSQSDQQLADELGRLKKQTSTYEKVRHHLGSAAALLQSEAKPRAAKGERRQMAVPIFKVLRLGDRPLAVEEITDALLATPEFAGQDRDLLRDAVKATIYRMYRQRQVQQVSAQRGAKTWTMA